NDETLLKSQITEGVDINAQDSIGCTPLHWAAFRGFTALVRMLIEAKADIAASDWSNSIPLHW
ncbi:unnamed protein product, partial [Choristocarpus tenellus]